MGIGLAIGLVVAGVGALVGGAATVKAVSIGSESKKHEVTANKDVALAQMRNDRLIAADDLASQQAIALMQVTTQLKIHGEEMVLAKEQLAFERDKLAFERDKHKDELGVAKEELALRQTVDLGYLALDQAKEANSHSETMAEFEQKEKDQAYYNDDFYSDYFYG